MTRSIRRAWRRLPMLVALATGLVAMLGVSAPSASAYVSCSSTSGTLAMTEDTPADIDLLDYCTASSPPIFAHYAWDDDGVIYGTTWDGPIVTITAPSNYSTVVPVDVHIGTADQDYSAGPALTIAVTVAAVPDAPACPSSAPQLGTEDEDATGTISCPDVDGDAVSYSIEAGDQPQAGKGAVTIDATTGAFTYTPPANYHFNPSVDPAVAAFTVTATSAGGLTDEVEVTVNVQSVDDESTCDSLTYTIDEGGSLDDAPLDCADVDGAISAYGQGDGVATGTATIAGDGTFDYASPFADFNGFDTFDVVTTDAAGGQTTHVVTINLTPVNDAPTCPTAAAPSTDEDVAVVTAIGCTDVDDNDSLTYAIVGTPANGSVSITNANAAFTPSANVNGSGSYTLRASDGTLTADRTFNVTITALDDAPTCPATLAVTTFEDTPVTTPGGCTDVDGDTLTYTVSGTPNGGTVAIDTDEATFTPTTDLTGTADYVLVASDGNGPTAARTFNVTITAADDAPTCPAATPFAVTEDLPATTGLGCSDIDGAITYTVTTQSARGVATISGTNVTYAPVANATGVDSFTVTATSAGESATSTFDVTIAPVNDATTCAAALALSLRAGQSVGGTLACSDVDGSPTYSIATAASRGSVTLAGPTYDYTTASLAAGTDSFTLRATQGGATTDVVVTVTIVATPPVVVVPPTPPAVPVGPTPGNDRLTGTSTANRIDGGAGNDVIDGAGGNDRLFGGLGLDRLIGGDGNDRLVGGAGDDVLLGNRGNDVLVGQGGTDVLNGGIGNDLVSALDSAATVDRVICGPGRDVVLADRDDVVARDCEVVTRRA